LEFTTSSLKLRDQELADLKKEIEVMKPKCLNAEEKAIVIAFHNNFNEGFETIAKITKFKDKIAKYDLSLTNRVFSNMPLSLNNALSKLNKRLFDLEKKERELATVKRERESNQSY
jgi:hypothetical protein